MGIGSLYVVALRAREQGQTEPQIVQKPWWQSWVWAGAGIVVIIGIIPSRGPDRDLCDKS
jgi:hypothetical protein